MLEELGTRESFRGTCYVPPTTRSADQTWKR